MNFSNVIGQSPAKAFLRKMADSGRIPHALMFLGSSGSGGLALAWAFAQYVLCENKSGGEPCGQCSNCAKADKLVHPDLHFSFPTVGANVTSDAHLPEWRKALGENPYFDVNQWLQRIGAENKQGNINKEECVQIVKKLSLKTFEGSYKILLMWLPEYLGKEGNRLLKLIEEPPDDTLLIFVAENQELILNTILSRCQLVKVDRLSDEEVQQGLMALKKLPLEKAMPIANLSDGNFNEALKIAAQPESDNSALFLDWLRKCYKGNGVEMAHWVEQFSDLGRENQKQFLQYGLHFIREYMALKMTGKTDVRLLAKERDSAQNLTKIIGFGQIGRIAALFNDCAYFIERNANQKILFLDASIQLNKILRGGTS
jgi:DNA polymerase-3 subunit delta'